jgi:steroid delta-isomerase-like uncharacterized protein
MTTSRRYAEMGATDTREMARVLGAYAEAKNEHDIERILELCHEDCYYETAGLGLRVEGREALGAFYTALFSTLPDYHGEFDGTAYADDSAVVWGRFAGTTAGSFLGLDAEPGLKIEVPVTFVCTFRGGLLASDTGYFNVAALADQAGVSVHAADSLQIPTREEDAARELVANFQRLWKTRDPEIVREIVSPTATAHWSGIGTFPGSEYVERMTQTMALTPDIENEVTGYAINDDLVFISWRAHGTIFGGPLEWHGIDRFRLAGTHAEEIHAIFDTAPLRDAVVAAGENPTEYEEQLTSTSEAK